MFQQPSSNDKPLHPNKQPKRPKKAYSPEIGFSSTLNLLDGQIQKEILKYGKLFRFGPEFFEKIRNKDLQISYLKSKEF